MSRRADPERGSPDVIRLPGRAPYAASTYRDRNSTADRALDVLLMFTEERSTVAAGEVASHLNVARSTAYRYLESLLQSGFVEEHSGGGLRLGPRVLELARLVRRASGLSEVSAPVMRRLSDATGETVLLTRLAGTSVLCLERTEVTGRAVRITYERGQVLPTNAGASARVLLAWLDDVDLHRVLAATEFTRFTDRTIDDPDLLRERLAETRAQGVAISRGELDPDVIGIAAPVRGADGTVVAGLSLAALASRVPDDDIGRIVDDVRRAAEEITNRMALLHM